MKRKIVILEYDEAVRTGLEGALARSGYEVYSAVTGMEGLQLISDIRPELIILDPVLPALSGYALMDVLAAKGFRIPILVITSDVNLVDNLALQGIAGLLLKPVDPVQLVAHVDAIIKLRDASVRMEGPVNRVWEQEHRKVEERLLTPYEEAQMSAPSPAEPVPAPDVAVAAEPTFEPEPARKKPLVLVVDDEPDMLKVICDFLKFKGFEVSSAVDGQDALARIKREMPNVVLLDVMLPKMDGYQLCRMLKFDDKFRGIPIIMLTARQTLRDKEIAVASGADGFIAKPFKNEVLLGEIARALKNAGSPLKPAVEAPASGAPPAGMA